MACTPLSVTVFVLMGISGLLWIIAAATDSMVVLELGNRKESSRFFPEKGQDDLPDWWKASQAMALIGLLALGGAAVVSLLTLCCKDCGRRFILILQTAALFGSGACIILSVIIFGSKTNEELKPLFTLGYSYAILCVSGGFAVIAGIVCLVDMIKGD